MQHREATPSSDQRNAQEIGSRSTWHVPGLLKLAIFALPVWLALAPYPTFAVILGSRATNANIPLPVGTWRILNQIPVQASDVRRYCTAVGSADVRIPAGMNSTYLFTLTADVVAPPMNLGQERTVQSVPGGPLVKEVTTTQGFSLEANAAHVIYWLGLSPVAPPTVVLDRSLTVVCDGDGNPLGVINKNLEHTPTIDPDPID